MVDRCQSLQDAGEPDLDFEDIDAAYRRALEVADAADQLAVQEAGLIAPEQEACDHSDPPPTRLPDESEPLHAVQQSEHAASAALSISVAQVLEALLFVGGGPLPGRRIGELLGGELSPTQVEELIDELNQRYASQGRPYHVRLMEGGYEMLLRAEFEPVRSSVYGQGPKEVKLSQDVLEVLAFVAYRQPVTLADVVETGKKNAAAHLRQLLRRQLIELRRGDQPGAETYHTTPRFLQLFGLAHLRDLPQAADFDFK